MTSHEGPEAPAPEPPWSREAEQSLLGALLQDATALALVSDLVAPESMYNLAHRHVLRAVCELVAERHPVDPVTVLDRLQAWDVAEAVGGLVYLNELVHCVPGVRAVRRYAEVVAEKAAERALIAAQDEAARIAGDHKLTLETRYERMRAVLQRAEQARKAPTGHRVPLLGLDELRKASEAVRWVVKHVVPADSIGMMFGGSGTFKSFIALDCALHVAHGLPWMGRLTKQGTVVYIAAEGGAGLWQRINAWHQQRNLPWKGADLRVVPVALDLTQEAWRVVEAAQLAGVNPAMVVVDTLSQTYAGEENSANEMAAYLRELGLRFRALWNCAVLLIHHSGHQATERPRGSSAIRANLDYLLGVFRDEKEMLATVSCVKQKDGELFDDAMFQMRVRELGLDEDGDKLTSLVAMHLGSQEAVQAALEAEANSGRAGRQTQFMALVQNGMAEKELRKLFYDLLPELDAEARRKAYGRARKLAEQRGEMEVAQGFVIDLRGRNRGA